MNWNIDIYIEIFGAATGIIYVFLEIRQNRLLWPVGIVTSAVYIWVFFTGRLYADMGLQGYYLVISVLGWYWWAGGSGLRAQGSGRRLRNEVTKSRSAGAQGAGEKVDYKSAALRENSVYSVVKEEFGTGHRAPSFAEASDGKAGQEGNDGLLKVTRLKLKTGFILSVVFLLIFTAIWYVLDRFTDSPVPVADSFITSLSIIATWMLARKIYEHWYLWIIVNSFASVLFLTRELYPTVILYMVYFVMSFAGLIVWRKTLPGKTRSTTL